MIGKEITRENFSKLKVGMRVKFIKSDNPKYSPLIGKIGTIGVITESFSLYINFNITLDNILWDCNKIFNTPTGRVFQFTKNLSGGDSIESLELLPLLPDLIEWFEKIEGKEI